MMFANGSSYEEDPALEFFLGSLTNKERGPHNLENLTGEQSSDLSFTITESPFFSAELLAQSWWNIFNVRYFRYSTGWTVFLIAVYMFISVVGVIGNSMVIMVVVLRPQMRSVKNMFIMNLAVANFFLIVFCTPAALLSNIFHPWILGSYMCKCAAYLHGVAVCASVYSLAAVSFDRCRAIYSPLVRYHSKMKALATICLIWIISVLLAAPWAVIFNIIDSDTNGMQYCIETWENEFFGKVYFLVVNLLCCYFLPLVIILISNSVIWRQVANRKLPQDSASVDPIQRMHKITRHRVLKMLGFVTLIFVLCWLPLYIILTRRIFEKYISETEANVIDFVMPFAQWLGSFNSSINPILYAFLNKKFRDMLRSIFPWWIPFVHRINV